MEQTGLKPVLFEGELLDLWRESYEEFSRTSTSKSIQDIPELALNDPAKWSQTFNRRHKASRFDAVSVSAIGRHIQGINLAINAISSVFQLVAAAVPIVTPVTVVVQAFALAFQAFEYAQGEREKVEAFFKEMETLFKEVSTLSSYLQGERRVAILKSSVVQVFVCSLKICGNIINDGKGTIKKWILTLSGDSELDGLLGEMSVAKKHLWRCVNAATYAEMRAAGHKLDAVLKWTHRQDRDDILDWLSSLNFDTVHQRQLEQVEGRPNAGKWLLESDTFRKWKENENSRLWYTGKHDSIIIRHLENTLKATEDDPAVVFLYMSHKSSPTVQGLLGCILRQIVADMVSIHPNVEAEWNKKATRGRTDSGLYAPPDQATLVKLLSELTGKRKLYVVLDAMDECSQSIRQELLTKLKKISNDVRILVTARLLENRDELSKNFDMQPIQARRSDIDEYIDSVIEKDAMLQKGHRDRIKRTVREKAGGMFLLAKLHMHAMSNLDNQEEVLYMLETLPDSVDKSYANALARIQKKDDGRKRKALMILAWVSFAKRLLKCDELSHAIATQVSQNEIRKKDLISKENIASLCCGMIEIDVDDIVRFVHYSAQYFFEQKKSTDFADYNIHVPLACAKYLCMKALSQDTDLRPSSQSIQQKSTSEKLKSFPFARYASQFLHDHFRPVRNQKEGEQLLYYIRTLVTERSTRNFYYELLCDSESYFIHVPFLDGRRTLYDINYGHWSSDEDEDKSESDSEDESESDSEDESESDSENDSESDSENDSESDSENDSVNDFKDDRNGEDKKEAKAEVGEVKDKANSLHLAVFLGCPELVKYLVKQSSRVDELDRLKQTPLMIAFKKDFGDIAGILLDNGATVDLSNKKGHAFILYAAQRNYDKAVAKILESTREAEIKWTFLDLWTLVFCPLLVILWLIRGTQVKSVSLSQSCLLDATECDEQNPTPNREQQLLKQCGRVLSLAYEGKANKLNDFINSASFRASQEPENTQGGESSNREISRMREENLSDTDLQASDFLTTACFLAVERGHANIVGLLLDHGVLPNAKNFHGQPLLHRATFRERIDIVELLLEKGAQLDLVDNDQRTAYTCHANVDNTEVLRYLQDKGANIDHRGSRGVHELYRAAAFGNEKMVRFFLEAGVSPSIVNVFSWAPLHEASANAHLECVKLLLVDYHADPSPISDIGKTPLDLVISGEPHYDWPCLGKDPEHYLNGRVYAEKSWDLRDQERLEAIQRLLEDHGAKTSEELYQMDCSKFRHVEAGIYAGGDRYNHLDFSDSESEERSGDEELDKIEEL